MSREVTIAKISRDRDIALQSMELAKGIANSPIAQMIGGFALVELGRRTPASNPIFSRKISDFTFIKWDIRVDVADLLELGLVAQQIAQGLGPALSQGSDLAKTIGTVAALVPK